MFRFNASVNDQEWEDKPVQVFVGGQTNYPEGPSVLLTVEWAGRKRVEIQVPFEDVDRLIHDLKDRRDSWSRQK